jgi:hypothetical protein
MTRVPSVGIPIRSDDPRGVLLTFRCSVPEELIVQLERTEPLLSFKAPYNEGRGHFTHRHYAAWGDYSLDIHPSVDYINDLNWIEANKELWDFLSNLLQYALRGNIIDRNIVALLLEHGVDVSVLNTAERRLLSVSRAMGR